MFRKFETEFAGRPLVIETGKMAGLANGSVLVRYGDTCVLVNVTASKEPIGIQIRTDNKALNQIGLTYGHIRL